MIHKKNILPFLNVGSDRINYKIISIMAQDFRETCNEDVQENKHFVFLISFVRSSMLPFSLSFICK